MNKLLHFTLSATLVAFAVPGLATDDHKGHDHGGKSAGHAHDAKPAHGGVVAVVKDVNYELVAKADTLALYVSDHGKAVDLKGASAKVSLLSADGRGEADLAPAGDRLEARGAFKVAPGTKVVAQVKLAGASSASVRFTLK